MLFFTIFKFTKGAREVLVRSLRNMLRRENDGNDMMLFTDPFLSLAFGVEVPFVVSKEDFGDVILCEWNIRAASYLGD